MLQESPRPLSPGAPRGGQLRSPRRRRRMVLAPALRKRAASCPAGFNGSDQSNQQDLIGQVEADRQQKPARWEALLRRGASRRKRVSQQQCERRLRRRGQRVNDRATGRNHGAFGPLAILRPMMCVVCVLTTPILALPSRRGRFLGRRCLSLTVTCVRMVAATAHRQVDHQERGNRDAAQQNHAIPRLHDLHYRQQNYTTFTQTVKHEHPPLCGRCRTRLFAQLLNLS